MLLSVWMDTSSRNILWEPWVTVNALRAWKWLFQSLGPGSTHCRALPFLLLWGEAEFLLSAALFFCFLAHICTESTSSCWENGPWGIFRDIFPWRGVAAASGVLRTVGSWEAAACAFGQPLVLQNSLTCVSLRKETTGNVVLLAPGRVIRTLHEKVARSLKLRRSWTFSHDKEWICGHSCTMVLALRC